MEEPAVALKVAVVAPAAIVTEAGTVIKALLLLSVMLVPPGGAGCETSTVQVLTPLAPTLAGLHAIPETVVSTTIPLVPAGTVNPEPLALTPIALTTDIAAVVALGASVN